MTKGQSLCHIHERGFFPFRAHLNAQSGRNPRSFRAEGVARDLACLQLLEHSGATVEHVAVGGIEVAGVPRVGHVAGAIGPIEQA